MFHIFHKWGIIRVIHYLDNSYDHDGIKSTKGIYKCNCGAIRKKIYYGMGYLTIEDLK